MKQRKIVSFSLIFALILGMLIAPNQADAKKKKKVALNKTKLTLTVGKSYKLKLKNNKKKIKWTSSKKKVATVSKTGKVKAKKAGTARITAKVGKKKYVCKVTVKNKKKTTKTTTTKKPTVTKAPANNTNTVKATPSPTPYVAATDFTVENYPTAMEITGDNVWPLTVNVSPSNATEKVKFTVDNPELATVDSYYNFKATGIGKVTVTASISNGKTQSFVCELQEPYQTSSHDPSVVKGDDGYYYIFGSHLAFAKTDNLIGWTQVTNNVTKDTSETGSVFASYWGNWAKYNKNGVANKDNSG
ncbi:MAG: Ig-like domain-containing protein, partial [Eubacterium sp.]|nr:Ig-like domain-containing protein [Eubacterium sp.]